MPSATLQKTNRRQNYESYIRFLLENIGVSDRDIEEYLTTPQAVYDNKSLLELIYTGDADKVVKIIEDETYEDKSLS